MPIQRSNEPDKFRAFEQTGWDEAIDGYERAFGPLTAQTVEPLLDAAGVAARSSVLDVCTGHGAIAAAAVSRGAIVSGADLAEQVVATARRNVPEAEFRQADAQALPYASGTFDAVICAYGIIHVPEPERALAEMVRVTRSGGRVAASVWERPLPTNGFGLLFGAIKAHGRLDIPIPHGPDFFQFSDAESLKAALEWSGLTNISVRMVNQTLSLRNPADFINTILVGTVRAKALLAGQTPGALSAIKTTVENGMDHMFRDASGYSVPMAALVGGGTKP